MNMAKDVNIPVCHTVEELRKALADLPGELEIQQGFRDGTKPVWFNRGNPNEHLSFEENDGTFYNMIIEAIAELAN